MEEMLKVFLTRILAAAKNAVVGYTGHILLETGTDNLAAENGDLLTAEGG